MIIAILGLLIALLTVLLFITFCVKIIGFLLKKNPFPKKLLITASTGVILVFSLLFYQTYFFTFSSIDRSNMEQGPGPVPSPSGNYSAHAFYEPYGGAAGGVNVWVEITHHQEKEKVKTIYFADAKIDFSMKWIDDDQLSIVNNDPDYPDEDRSIVLKPDKEIYDESGLACQSLLMKDEYERCYQD
ncbi:hypothetical protein GKZ89_15565 [Bacillus mangrovi]|uniref:Uncharacterized protein n=1 Tax=Metabacillus mangrovi TaxID=1491830 RepID=A0A7X2S7Q3_9BACI|nr:DUF5412 family protein [Metabacillus mangrovi]MTH54820.1 hypothetical protein [Metabacillus mangrovi]